MQNAAKAQRLKAAGRLIGFLASGLMLFMFIGEFFAQVSSDSKPIETAGVLLILLGIAGLFATILSYKNIRAAALLIALVGIGVGAHIAAYAGRNHVMVWLITGFPFIISAYLLFYSYRLSIRSMQ